MSLGPAAAKPPTLENRVSDWQAAVTLQRFYHIHGLDAPVTSVETRFLWDDTALYMLCKCADPGLAGYAEKRQDQIEFFLSGGYPNSSAYEQFVITNSGRTIRLHTEQGDTREITPTGFSAQVQRQGAEWLALVTIPWQAIGGKPAAPFSLLVMRDRQQYSETTSPLALDRRWSLDPSLFIETSLGGQRQVITLPGSLVTLPSGLRRWQAPAVLSWPGVAERQTMWEMQQQLAQPTTPETLATRLYLAQRQHDVLRLEGYSFDPGQNVLLATQPAEYTLESARSAVNAALRQNDVLAACHVADVLLKHFDTLLRHWFADGSPGNIDTQAWTALDRLDGVEQREQEILLHGAAGAHPVTLHLSCPVSGGIRLHAEAEGFFTPGALAPLHLTSSHGQYRVAGPENVITLQSGEKWSITVADVASKAIRWQLRNGDVRFRFTPTGAVSAVDLQWGLTRAEAVYGFGERFNALNQRGKVVSLWDFDAWEGTSSWGFENQAYKIVQLLHSSRGYSLFYNATYRLRADIGNGDPQRCRLTMLGPVLDIYLWTTPPLRTIQSYTAVTGKPLLPPRWAFEPWAGGGMGRWANGPAKNATQEIINVMQRFRKLDIPHAAVYAEGDVSADPRLYTALAPYNIRILTWGRSQVWGRNRLLPDVPGAEYPTMRFADGKPVQYPRDNPIAGNFPYLDFTNPHALEVLRVFWKKHLDLGVAGSMIDFGDMVPEEAKFYDGRTGDAMHNFYAYDYHKTFNTLYKERRGDDFVLFSRSAAPGSQAFCCQMAGDHEPNFSGMTAAMRGGLNLAASGLPFWGCDIGGYAGRPDEETYLRWVQWGAFSPLMRVHGTDPREPWNYSDNAVRIYKKYTWLRENLLDYIYSAVIDAHITGVPLMQPMPMAFPGQPKLAAIDDEYLFGADLLVTPVHTAGEARQITFPAGHWTHLWNGTSVPGNTTQTVPAPMEDIPLYLRAGAMIPLQLSPSLQLGESMTNGKVTALIITPPTEARTVRRWKTADEGMQYTMTPTRHGMSLTLDNHAEVQDILLYGASAPIAHIAVDGVELPAMTAEHRADMPSGWYSDGLQRTIIHLPRAGHLVVVTFGNTKGGTEVPAPGPAANRPPTWTGRQYK